jgi:hypothetical protein
MDSKGGRVLLTDITRLHDLTGLVPFILCAPLYR